MTDVEAAEKAIIGAVLLSQGKVLDDLTVDADDFWSPAMGALYGLMQSMRRAGKPVDLITVVDAVAASGLVELRPVDTGVLHNCVEATPTAANADFYAEIVTEEAIWRRLRAAGQGVVALTEQRTDLDAAVDRARALVDGAAKINTERIQSFGETLDATLDSLERAVQSHLTPWASLNKGIGGWAPGRLYIVGARPGVGKSVAALQAALGLTKKGAVALISLEMSVEEIQTRAIAYGLKISLGKLERRDLDESDWEKIAARRAAWNDLPLFVSDESAVTMAGIRKYVRSTARRGQPLAGIVLDYIQLVSAPRGWQGKRQELISDIARELKIMAREFNVPVIALSQLNRQSESREDKRPSMSDLRESGALEQDADVVILLHRDMANPANAHELHMIVAKNRHGATGASRMHFIGHHSEIRDIQQAPPETGGTFMERTGNAEEQQY